MGYKIVVTKDAEEDLDKYVRYLLFEKRSEQAARNLLNDFEATKIKLESAAESLKLCENQRLHSLGYRRINFMLHGYFMLYRVKDKIVYIDSIFHELQDYENKLL